MKDDLPMYTGEDVDKSYQQGYKQGRTDYENECAKRYCCYSGKDCIIGNLVEKDAYKQGREDAISEAISEISKYASVWMSYTDGMTKEQIAHEALNASKDAMIGILERMERRTDDAR